MREWLRTARTERHRTMKDMATAMNITEGHYCLIEHGKKCRVLDVMQIYEIAEALRVPFWVVAAKELEYSKKGVGN